MSKIAFGKKVRDSVTGFVGFVTARCEYMNGCIQYEITPAELKDGVPQKEYWLDEQRVLAVKPQKEKYVSTQPTIHKKAGGPQNHPAKSNPPPLAGY